MWALADVTWPTPRSEPDHLRATTNTAITNGFTYAQIQRPYFGQYPNFAKITQTSSFGSSNCQRLPGLHPDAELAWADLRAFLRTLDQLWDTGADQSKTTTIRIGLWFPRSHYQPGEGLLDLHHSHPHAVLRGWSISGSLADGRPPARSFQGGHCRHGEPRGSCNQSPATGNTYALTCSGLGVGEGAGRAILTGFHASVRMEIAVERCQRDRWHLQNHDHQRLRAVV